MFPPCERSFIQHIKRVQWQVKLWTHAHEPKPELGSPLVDHGWKLAENSTNKLVPIYFEGPTASEVLQDLICNCSARGKCSTNCSCHLQTLPCSDLCSCGATACKNPLNAQNIHLEIDTDDDDDQ